MPTTRKKVIKTVYKHEDSEEETGDFSDSGSEARISEESESSDAEESELVPSSGDEFNEKSKRKVAQSKGVKKTKFAKAFLSKINKQSLADSENNDDVTPTIFTVKDLTDADKLLPPILNLSESDSSDDEDSNKTKKNIPVKVSFIQNNLPDSDKEDNTDYKDVWSNNIQDDSEEIAKKTFMELEKHKSDIEKTKASLQNYTNTIQKEEKESNVTDLLALGEEILPTKSPVKKKRKSKKKQEGSDSDVEDWEEVKEGKIIPQQGLQLFVEFPDAVRKKAKTVDIEMMMKRKLNRVKKEYQVYMHKVHVLCWLGHGNYVSPILNDQELLAAALSLVPSKECYPGERVDMKFVEQITIWYRDKLTLKQDKNEDKFKPKAPPLKQILIEQIKKKVVTTKKYLVFIFVAILRAMGLQCRVMFNFVTLPIKPLSSELCSLSMKDKKDSSTSENKSLPMIQEDRNKERKSRINCCKKINKKAQLPQVDGNYDSDNISIDDSFEYNIMQVDGNDDTPVKTRSLRSTRANKTKATNDAINNEDVSPPKILKKNPTKERRSKSENNQDAKPSPESLQRKKNTKNVIETGKGIVDNDSMQITSQISVSCSLNNEDSSLGKMLSEPSLLSVSSRKTRSNKTASTKTSKINTNVTPETNSTSQTNNITIVAPKIVVTDENEKEMPSKFFNTLKPSANRLTRKRSQSSKVQDASADDNSSTKTKARTKSAPGTKIEKSKYFDNKEEVEAKKPRLTTRAKKDDFKEVQKRVSHRDLVKTISKPKNDIKNDLVDIIKSRIKVAKAESKKRIVKGKALESDEDSDYLPEETPKRKSESEDDFKPTKISPKPSTSKKIDRRVLSSDDEKPKNKVDVWCEVFVEELEQWVCVDILKAKVHAKDDIYLHATHPVCYVVGWDNNNYLKDITRRYVPHWNTVTRKLRVESAWWDKALKPWLGPKTARDREEDECLDRMQLEAPLPKSIAEYKNHPLYALKRHLLKFEAIYPPDAATLGFVRGEPVYGRDCVYVCRSRDTWLKEAKVVRLAELPYKVVKARPKWDKLSNKLITDKPLEVFGPWQVQDYEPPVAENGIVPRNAYGNVELFKECMLPKGTVHVKLPGLNKVARKLNIDCAPAMTGFDFNGGWSHPVYDGFVVCKEFEEVITEAWLKEQEEQERRELEKIEARVYGNWRKLIKGLFIRERLKNKYGFEDPSTSKPDKSKSKGPKLVVKKRT